MARTVEFPSNGSTCGGYLAEPDRPGPGVIVVQEWWGLVDHIRDVCDRFAAEGYVALAPDLYHGKSTEEPDEAMKLMMGLQIEQAAKDMSGAVDFLHELDVVAPKKVGSVGFCMGGALSLVLATVAPIEACVAFYGLPQEPPDWSNLRAPVQGHFAEHDDFFSADAARKLFQQLGSMGNETELHVYEGAQHAFFNDERPDVHDAEAAAKAWERTLGFFRDHLQ